MRLEPHFESWQINTAAFALPWWLFVAPSTTRWMWSSVLPGSLPSPVDALLNFCWLWILLGFIYSLGALSSDFKHRTTLQSAARWFVAGTFSLPVWAMFLSSF
jgi:hypothetical protein